MSGVEFTREGLRLSGFDGGAGPSVIFQHGLGGDLAQVAEVFPEGGFRRLTLECRAQGASEAGEPERFSIQTFADDIVAFAQSRGVTRFAVGGISMGAAIALNIAVRHPQSVTALILARPAWLTDNAPANMQPLTEVADYVEKDAREEFEASALATRLMRQAPDNLASMRSFFSRPNPAVFARLLRAISRDGPGVSLDDIRALAVPALVLCNQIDVVHPVSHAQELAKLLPRAQLREIAPKALDRARHAADFRAAVHKFLSDQGANQ